MSTIEVNLDKPRVLNGGQLVGEIDSAFIIRKASSTFIALDRSAATVRVEHKFELEASRPDRFFVREFQWVSDEGIEKPPVIHSGDEGNGTHSHRLHGPVLVGTGSGRIAVIDLGRIVQVGETETVAIEHFFICTAPKNPGFIGHVTQAGCSEVTLRAVLPKGAGKRVRRRAFKNGADGSYIDESLETTSVGELMRKLQRENDWREYRWTIPDPIRGVKYRIEWDI